MASAAQSTSHEPEYAWEVATLYPAQGEWSEEDYLQLTDSTRRRIELSDGRLEFLPLPTEVHQLLAAFLYHALYAYVKERDLGTVHYSGLRVRVRPGKVREPDVVFLHKDHYHVRHNRVWDGADLVMEVVSDDPKDRDRDYQTKLVDYAEAKIAEYWIVDPGRRCLIVHYLERGQYRVHSEFACGTHADSHLLTGFAVDVTALFNTVNEVSE